MDTGELTFTKDWSGSRQHWPELFVSLGFAGKPNLRFLEIGCFEGQASVWLLDNILTARTSTLTVVDPFVSADGQYDRFTANTGGRTRTWVGRSQHIVPMLDPWFDFVYVDGSHESDDVLADAVNAWRLLKTGGVMLFDDYDWPDQPGGPGVRTGVDAFVQCFTRRIKMAGPTGRDQYIVVKALA